MSFAIRAPRSLLFLASLAAALCLLTGSGRAQITILPLGDSITYGFLTFTPADYGSAGYRYQLYQDLGASPSYVTFLGSQSDNGTGGQPLLPSSETANEGHNGYTIEGVDAELTANTNNQSGRSDSNNGGYWLTSGTSGGTPLNPQVVLLDVGTNDATDGESAATMDAQIIQLMSDLKTDLPSAQIFVGNLTPRLDNSSYETIEAQYNAALPAEISAEGGNFHFVDLYDAVSPSTIDAAGGYMHPDTLGYAQMGDAWYAALVADDIVPPVATPEPSTWVMMGLGVLALFWRVRRRNAKV